MVNGEGRAKIIFWWAVVTTGQRQEHFVIFVSWAMTTTASPLHMESLSCFFLFCSSSLLYSYILCLFGSAKRDWRKLYFLNTSRARISSDLGIKEQTQEQMPFLSGGKYIDGPRGKSSRGVFFFNCLEGNKEDVNWLLVSALIKGLNQDRV